MTKDREGSNRAPIIIEPLEEIHTADGSGLVTAIYGESDEAIRQSAEELRGLGLDIREMGGSTGQTGKSFTTGGWRGNPIWGTGEADNVKKRKNARNN